MSRYRDSVAQNFHRIFYNSNETWNNTTWLGTKILKYPGDLVVYQELIYSIRPDVIVECGTRFGGSAFFLASLFDLIGNGRIISIDIDDLARPPHPRVKYLLGSSTDPAIFETVSASVDREEKVLVILDSDHSKDHVLKEMELWSPIVTVDSYLIVEDSNINGHPVHCEFGEGPMEAIRDFLKTHDEFETDLTREKFLITFNPGGYLRRIR